MALTYFKMSEQDVFSWDNSTMHFSLGQAFSLICVTGGISYIFNYISFTFNILYLQLFTHISLMSKILISHMCSILQLWLFSFDLDFLIYDVTLHIYICNVNLFLIIIIIIRHIKSPSLSLSIYIYIYSGYGKYSDPLKFFTLCYIAAIC